MEDAKMLMTLNFYVIYFSRIMKNIYHQSASHYHYYMYSSVLYCFFDMAL